MKKILLILKLNLLTVPFCLFVFSSNILYAQNKQFLIKGNKIDQKADKCNFTIYEQGGMNVVFNKNNSLMIYESSFVTKTDEINLDNIVKFNERPEVDSIIYKIIAPFYRNYKSKYKYEVEEFDIFLHSRKDGKVCELAFSYNRDTNIPLQAIEKIENEILALDLKLDFDPNSHYTEDALWIYYPLKYSVSRMKEKLKTEKK
jgi:hypothetical protein